MRARPALAVAARGLVSRLRIALVGALMLAAGCGATGADNGPAATQRITNTVAIASAAAEFPATPGATPLDLPDDWSRTRPGHRGDVWYRARFELPQRAAPDELLGLYIERACSTLDVRLNDQRISGGAGSAESMPSGCRRPRLIDVPAALLRPAGNVLDIRVTGDALQRVAFREFAAGLSALQIGPQAALVEAHARRLFWNVTWVQITGVALAVLGALLLVLAWQNPHEVYFGYAGGVALAWAVLSVRFWLPEMPWAHAATDYAFCVGLATLVGLAVQFLLSYAGLRSRAIEAALVFQWLMTPVTLVIGGEARLFAMANLWHGLFTAELLAVSGLYLVVTWRERRHEFRTMVWVLGAAALLMLAELAAQQGAVVPWDLSPLTTLMPVLLFIVGVRLMLMFARALRASEAGRTALARRVRELTTEFEGNFSQLAELRVEQVTERERKRIAADLHDDLGAKLLTIVHTSDNERITVLAREALEDMRLSVKGLIGRPMRLADALADWRAETVARLSQSQIEVDWQSPTEETDHLLPSRSFVQTTRILRESVSNIVKHSGATRCTVRCRIAEGQFAVTIRDNGHGIPMELDGKLDRGLGMSSMKRRAKQMHGQCLVQSGPGYGTVIALTVPL